MMNSEARDGGRAPVSRGDMTEVLFPPLVLLRWRATFRQFLIRTIARQYRVSTFGVLWAVLVPLITLAIYSFVFGTIMPSRWEGVTTASGEAIPFTLYIFAGLVVFWLMAQAAAESCNAVVSHTNLVKKAVFPLEIIPLTTVGGAVFHCVISTLVLIAATFVMQGSVPATALLFPLILLPFVLLLAGVAWFLSALGVYFRDLNHIIGLVMTGVLFLSPVFYPLSHLSPRLQMLVLFNPISFIVMQGRLVLLEGRGPDWGGVGCYLLVAWVIASLGLMFFRRARRNFADVL